VRNGIRRYAYIIGILLVASFSIGDSAVVFIQPLKAKIHPSSLFGDYRPGHFHAGIDIRTGGKTGFPLYAVSDGYIQRVVVSFNGYGRGVYLKCKSGNVVVYGHLSRFFPALQKVVYKHQVEARNYYLDEYFEPNDFPVHKGDIIGYSGQSGPGAPHLHYEIRTPNNKPINPLNGYLHIDDKIAPVFSSLAAVEFSDGFTPSDIKSVNKFNCRKTKGSKTYSLDKPVVINGRFGLEINVFDKVSNYNGKMGVYELEFFLDNELIFFYRADKLDFANFKQADYVRDYSLWYESVKGFKNPKMVDNDRYNFYRLYRPPGDSQPTVKVAVHDGYFSQSRLDSSNANIILPGRHKIRIVTADINGNGSELDFEVHIRKPNNKRLRGNSLSTVELNKIHYNGRTDFLGGKVSLGLSDADLYYSETFKAVEISDNKDTADYKVIYQFELLPLFTFFKDAISLEVKLGDVGNFTPSKYCLGWEDIDGKYLFCGNSLNNDSTVVSCDIGSTGKFALVVDNIPPQLELIEPRDGAIIKSGKNVRIQYRMKDNFSGLGNERDLQLYLDGKWVPAEYDPDRDLIEFIPPFVLKGGRHSLYLIVVDRCANKSELKNGFVVR